MMNKSAIFSTFGRPLNYLREEVKGELVATVVTRVDVNWESEK